jgi:4-amino-4-deoxy-L-arabinose transferase-like glycosyltransferase
MNRRATTTLRPRVLLALLAAAIGVYFVNLGVSSIWDANEAFYVETPREMMERGDYVSPTFNYQPRLNKPVLSYWIVAGFYHLFGVSVGVQRIPIALGAMVIIAAAFFLARAAWPDRAGARLAALWAAIGLAVAPRLMMFARRIFIDIYISMFMALTLLFFALSERYPERRRLCLVLMYVSVGLGVLTKGPAFALLPGLVFAVYLVAHRELPRAREMMIPTGILIVTAIVVPWYVALYQRDGWTYILSFVIGENLARYTEGVGVNAERGLFWYVPVVFSDSFPWTIFLFVAGAAWIADLRTASPVCDAGFRIRTLLWIWILTIVAFFSLSAAKQDLYVFPIVPAVAALGGVAVAQALVRGLRFNAVRISTIVLGLLVIGLGGSMLYLFLGADAVYSLEGPALIGGAALAGGALTVLLAARAQLGPALIALAVTMIALNWVFVLRLLPSFEAYKPAPGFARVLEERAGPDDVIATYNVALPSLVFYLRRHVETAYDPAPIRRFLDSPRDAYVILPRADYELIRSMTSAPTCIVTTQPTFDVKLRNVIARDPLPDLLLISNRCQ